MQNMRKILHLPKIQMFFLLFLITVTTFVHKPSTQIIVSLLMSLGFTLLTELIFWKIRRVKLFLPEAALVTGLIIFLLESPTAPWYEFLVVAFLAVASKQFIRIKKRHIFNPAGFGLFFGNLLFGKTVAWWGVSWQQFEIFNLKFLIPLGILFLPLIISGVKMSRYLNMFSFLVFYAILNHRFIFDPTVIFFALVMLPEPMTTPTKPIEQIAFGIFVSFVSFIASLPISNFEFQISNFIPDLLIFSLLLGNFGFFVYNNFYKSYKMKPSFAKASEGERR